MYLPASYDQPAITRAAIREAVDAGFGHIVPRLSSPYPATVAQWVTDELVAKAA